MSSASTERGERGAVAGGAQRVGQAAVHEQRRVDPVREVAQLLHRVLEIGRDLVEHLLRGVGIGVGELSREPRAHRQRDEVLLRAVVQVALDAAPFEVGGLDDAGTGAPQLVGLTSDLVERVLQCRVELEVVQREADLARQLGEGLVVVFLERGVAVCPADDDHAEQLARVRDRRDADRQARRRVRSAPTNDGSHTRIHAGPETPARAMTVSSSVPEVDFGATTIGHRHRALELSAVAGPDLGQIEVHRLLQRFRELEQQLVERQGAGEPAAEGADDLVGRVLLAVDAAVGVTLKSLARRYPQQCGDRRTGNREPEDTALAGVQ